MKAFSPIFRQISALVLAAVLLQALAPALAASQQTEDKGHWSEICTVLGTKWIKQIAGNDGDSSSAHQSADGHCLFCTSTGPVSSFDASQLLARQTASLVRTYADTLAARAFSGHSILSRAPPR